MNAVTRYWFDECRKVALASMCRRSRCGAIIVTSGGQRLASGFNAPPLLDHRYLKCNLTEPSLGKPKSDRTCCVHAEQRALCSALRTGHLVEGSLFFLRLDDDGNPAPSGHPYCTVCSRLALDLGIKQWVLLHADGVRVWPSWVYNEVSHRFDEQPIGQPPHAVAISEGIL